MKFYKMRNALLLLFILSSSAIVHAQTPTPAITVSVTLNDSDWKYNTGQQPVFTIAVQKDGKDIKEVKTHIEIGPEKMPATTVKDTLLKKGRITINGGTLTEPGFLRCTVTTAIDGKTYKGMATAALSPGDLVATAVAPDDFNTFWKDAVTAARKIPFDTHMNLVKERSLGAVNVYEVSFQSFRNGSRIYGILCVPKKEGSYPALLKVPGAGVRAYKGDTGLAEKGVITFEIGIHGLPVTLPNEVYYNLASGALYEYYYSNFDSKDRYYYKRVYTSCVRAIDFLLTLPQADTSRIAVYGGSQGGALSIVTAALHPQVKYVAALYPALSDLTGYLHHRAGGWPHMFSPSQKGAFEKPEMIKTAGYYDVVNFARLINIPGWYSWGYNDEVCPPSTAYAVYNNIHATKDLFITKETGHWLSAPQAAESTNWLIKMLKVKE